MSYSVSGKKITLTRGDTFKAQISITDSDGNDYTPDEDDVIRFAMKKNYTDSEPLLLIDIPVDTLLLTIPAESTSEFAFGDYVYDIELTTADGIVDTFIPEGKLSLTKEVY